MSTGENADIAIEKVVASSSKQFQHVPKAAGNVTDGEKVNEEEEDSSSDDEDGREEGVYVVERIDDIQEIEGKTYYFIKWKGWDESANTWEPVENLEGCAEMLKDFRRRQQEASASERKIAVAKRRTSGRGRKKVNSDTDGDSDDEVTKSAQTFAKSYGIMEVWPAEKEPISVHGVISVDGILTYIVKKKTRKTSKTLDRTNACLVHADGFKNSYPQLVIEFYQSRILWGNDDSDDKEKAETAAQIALLQKFRGSKLGNEITQDLDKKVDLSSIASAQEPECMEVDNQTETCLNTNDELETSGIDKFGLPESLGEVSSASSTASTDPGDDDDDNDL